LVGALLGGFGVGLAWMRDDRATAQVAQRSQPAEPQHQERPKPKFDFYSLLPEEEVVVPAERKPEPVALPTPDQQTSAQVANAAPQAAISVPQTSSGPNSYVIQVASFRANNDAERLKAQLALLGVQTSIQTATAGNGQTYYRVRTGAFAKGDAAALQAKLKSKGHKPLMMRAQ
jgi:cell division protein FtsN